MTTLILTLFVILSIGIIKFGIAMHRAVIYSNAYALNERIRHVKPTDLTDWTSTPFKVAELPQFSFNQFLDFYKLNPEHWLIKSSDSSITEFPIRWEEDRERNRYNHYPFEHSYYKYYGIFFTNSKEYMKYRKWAAKEVSRQKTEAITKVRDYKTKEICDLVQTDIDAIRAEHQKHLENTVNLIADTVLKSVGK